MSTYKTLLGLRYKRRGYCVLGCDDLEGVPMHRFPHPERVPELLKSWLSMVGHKMKETDPTKIYKNKRICDHHFTSNQKLSSHRLIYEAVPTVNLDGVFLSSCVLLEHNYCLPKGIIPSSSVLQSSSGVVPHTEKDITLHCFPNPCDVKKPEELERFRTWVMRIGGGIVGEDDKYIHRNRLVCHRHFEDSFVYSSKQLNRLAIPTLHIPGHSILKEHNYYHNGDPEDETTNEILFVDISGLWKHFLLKEFGNNWHSISQFSR